MPLIADGVQALEAYLKRIREKNGLVPSVVTWMGNPEVHIFIKNAGGKNVTGWVTFENLDAFVEAVADIYEKNGISQWQKYSIGCHDIIDDAPVHAKTYRRADNDPRPL
jgi:TATA-box binding protein (TBP) (component of TFIID and TFIIIB)